MSLCGCYPSCACQLNVEPPELLSLTGNGDPLSGGWLLTANETVFGATNTDGGIDITPAGSYGHTPLLNLIVEDTDSVDLEVTPGDGITADVRIDPTSPITISVSVDGLRIESVPAAAGGSPSGAIIDYAGSAAPSGWLLAYGQLELVANYPDLFAVIAHTYNGGVDPGGGQFRIPDLRGRVTVGLDNMGGVDAGRLTAANTLGGSGGVESVQLAVANLPAHTHTEDAGGHTHTSGSHTHAITDPTHTHAPGTPSRSFVTVDAGFSNRDVNEATSGTPPNTRYVAGSSGGPTVQALTINESTSIPQQGNTQQNNANTAAAGTGITVNGASAIINANTADLVVVQGGGNGAALGNSFLILQPYMLLNKIIKT